MQATSNRHGAARLLPLVAAVVVGVPLIGMAMFLLFSKPSDEKRHVVQQITMVRLPPPPKPEEKPPEPPKVKEEVKIETPRNVEEPKPADNQPPPAGPLGLDAQGTGPGDGFGLAGRPGGRDITVGGGGGGGGLALMAFGTGAARHIAQELARDPRLKALSYRVEIRIWLSKDGRFEREELARGTGDEQVDTMIRDGLRDVSRLRQSVPDNLPQPLTIRVTSSDA